MTDDYDYNRENIIDELTGLADVRLSGSWTLDLTLWDDGDFRVVVYHLIDATYPHESAARGDEQGLPYYRERLRFSTSGKDEGWTMHEVVRRHCGETGHERVWSERVGGYTPNWPKPLLDDEDDDGDGSSIRIGYQGRFA